MYLILRLRNRLQKQQDIQELVIHRYIAKTMTRNCYKILNNSHPIVTVKTLEKEDADHVMIINAYDYQQK